MEHNEVIHALLTRRSIRSYENKEVPKKLLETILAAGSYAASGMNMQSAKAFVVQTPEVMEELVTLAKTVAQAAHNPFYDAPVAILVFAKRDCLTPQQDGTLALGNMMLAAHALGLGSCWIYAVTKVFASPTGKAFMKAHGIAEDYAIVGSLALGYPKGEYPQPKPRSHPFSAIL